LELAVALVGLNCGHPSRGIAGSVAKKAPEESIHFLTEAAHQNERAAGEPISGRFMERERIPASPTPQPLSTLPREGFSLLLPCSVFLVLSAT